MNVWRFLYDNARTPCLAAVAPAMIVGEAINHALRRH